MKVTKEVCEVFRRLSIESNGIRQLLRENVEERTKAWKGVRKEYDLDPTQEYGINFDDGEIVRLYPLEDSK